MGCFLIKCPLLSNAIGDIYVVALQEACLTRHAFDKDAPSLAAELLQTAAEDSQQQDMPQPQTVQGPRQLQTYKVFKIFTPEPCNRR